MRERKRALSPGWVVVSYFVVGGGFVLTMLVAGAAGLQARWIGWVYALGGAGAFVGGFFAARASPHHGAVEPALGGLLLVASIAGFFLVTPLGRALLEVARDEALASAALAGGVAFAGGFGGALVGGATAVGPRSPASARWLGISALATTGALFSALVITAAVLMRGLSPEAEEGTKSAYDVEAAQAFLIALAIASFVGALVTQMAAPARVLLGAAGGTLVAVGVLGLLIAGVPSDDPADVWTAGFALVAAAAFLVGLAGAAVGWALVRHRKAV